MYVDDEEVVRVTCGGWVVGVDVVGDASEVEDG